MAVAHGEEREGAEPEGGQYCDSRCKFLFEETAFSAAALIACQIICQICPRHLDFFLFYLQLMRLLA